MASEAATTRLALVILLALAALGRAVPCPSASYFLDCNLCVDPSDSLSTEWNNLTSGWNFYDYATICFLEGVFCFPEQEPALDFSFATSVTIKGTISPLSVPISVLDSFRFASVTPTAVSELFFDSVILTGSYSGEPMVFSQAENPVLFHDSKIVHVTAQDTALIDLAEYANAIDLSYSVVADIICLGDSNTGCLIKGSQGLDTYVSILANIRCHSSCLFLSIWQGILDDDPTFVSLSDASVVNVTSLADTGSDGGLMTGGYLNTASAIVARNNVQRTLFATKHKWGGDVYSSIFIGNNAATPSVSEMLSCQSSVSFSSFFNNNMLVYKEDLVCLLQDFFEVFIGENWGAVDTRVVTLISATQSIACDNSNHQSVGGIGMVNDDRCDGACNDFGGEYVVEPQSLPCFVTFDFADQNNKCVFSCQSSIGYYEPSDFEYERDYDPSTWQCGMYNGTLSMSTNVTSSSSSSSSSSISSNSNSSSSSSAMSTTSSDSSTSTNGDSPPLTSDDDSQVVGAKDDPSNTGMNLLMIIILAVAGALVCGGAMIGAVLWYRRRSSSSSSSSSSSLSRSRPLTKGDGGDVSLVSVVVASPSHQPPAFTMTPNSTPSAPASTLATPTQTQTPTKARSTTILEETSLQRDSGAPSDSDSVSSSASLAFDATVAVSRPPSRAVPMSQAPFGSGSSSPTTNITTKTTTKVTGATAPTFLAVPRNAPMLASPSTPVTFTTTPTPTPVAATPGPPKPQPARSMYSPPNLQSSALPPLPPLPSMAATRRVAVNIAAGGAGMGPKVLKRQSMAPANLLNATTVGRSPALSETGSGPPSAATHALLLDISQATAVMDMDDDTVEEVRYLGKGVFGEVYEYKWNYAAVAVKVMTKVTEATVVEFLEEAQMLATLRCPNIVAYLGICLDPLAIVTEFMPGGDLATFLDKARLAGGGSAAIDFNVHLSILSDVVKGLVYLHVRGVPHRDLKPANVLLTQYNEAKIADFGLAGDKAQSVAGAGTPRYNAPEVMLKAAATIESDMYSFGCVVLEVLTLKRPFASVTRPSERVENPTLLPATLTPSDFPVMKEGFLEVLSSLWEYQPSARPTASDVLDFFTSVLNGLNT